MMNNWIPDQFFRYRGVSSPHFEQELKELKNNKVWLGSIKTQNDPFEGVLCIEETPEASFLQQYEACRRYFETHFPDEQIFSNDISLEQARDCNSSARQFSSYVIQNVHIACFSRSWSNTLMWGHYADQFSGLCLCFEHDWIFTPEDAAPLYPVQYWKERPPGYSGLDFLISTTISNYVHLQRKSGRTYKEQTMQQLEEIAHEKLKLAATSKSYDWSYEEEFRLVSVREEPQYLRVPLKLKGVIFGPKATTDTRNQVMEQLGAEYAYSDMKLEANSYSYERIAISANSAGTVLR